MENLKIVFNPSSNKRTLKKDSDREVPFNFKNAEEKPIETNVINNNDCDHYSNYMIPYVPNENEDYLPLPDGIIATMLDSPTVSDSSSHKNDDFDDIESDCNLTVEEEDRLLEANDPENVPLPDKVMQKWNQRPDDIFKESHIIDSNFTGFVCEETDSRSRSVDFFKVPAMPLKLHTTTSSTANRFSPDDNFLTDREDDMISLCAPTLRDLDESSDTSESSDDEPAPARFKRHRSVEEPEQNNLIESENHRAVTSDNSESSKSENFRFEPPNSAEYHNIQTVTSKQLNFEPPDISLKTHNEWIDFRTVSPFFNRLCYHYWFRNKCNHGANCKKMHVINSDMYKTRCQNTSREVLCNLYNFTLRFKHLYQKMYPAFLHGFGFYKMQRELLSCIKDFFSMQVHLPSAITQLVQELQKNDMNLTDSVEMIIYKMGCDNYPILSTILLDILCHTFDITENWTIIKKIIKYGPDIPSELANRILRRLTIKYPCDKTVCMELHKLFFEDRKVDASQINPDLKTAIETVVNYCNKTPSPTTPVPIVAPSESSLNNSLEDNFPRRTAVESNKEVIDESNLNNENDNERNPIQQLSNKKIDLLPAVSIINKTIYDVNFRLDSSFHHLMPLVRQQEHLSEMDKCKLKKAIKSGDGSNFLEILEKYKDPSFFYDFAVEAFRSLRSMGHSYSKLHSLEQSIKEINPNYRYDLHLKVIFEVIVMNMLLHLEDKGYWGDASMLISHFRDWDSLISSQLFPTFAPRNLTFLGRYILLAKLLAKHRNFSLTYEILMQSELGLLKPNNDINDFDEESRDEVIMDFISFGYKMKGKDNMLMTIDIFRNIIKNNIFKPMFKKRLDTCLKFYIRESRIQDLRCFFEHIDVFYEHIEYNALRSFAITIYPHLSKEHISTLYDYCTKKYIYPPLTGQENVILVKTNMNDAEIGLLFTTYFYKLSTIDYFIPSDLCVEIVLYGNINQDLDLCKYKTHDLVRTVLFQKFDLSLPNSNSVQNIIIPKTEILKMLKK